MNNLLKQVIGIAKQAGDVMMKIYESDDFDIEIKEDKDFKSPLTKADKAANQIIETGLKQVSDYPIISEEGSHILDGSSGSTHLDVAQGNNEQRASATDTAQIFWLVDPLDGTKEFINRNGEFTVNIGLIKHDQPVLGVVYAPAKKVLYYGSVENGAYKQENGKDPIKIFAEYQGTTPIVVTSRSHLNEDTQKFLESLGEHKKISMGSSLKLCLVAEGKAAIYPRFAPTSLWDTAAADAVVRAAGGQVTDINGMLLKYRPQLDLLNPYFIVSAKNVQQPSLTA